MLQKITTYQERVNLQVRHVVEISFDKRCQRDDWSEGQPRPY
jgi:hypothetical protein